MMINGQAHGPQRGTATCQLHMRKFSDGDEIHIEPWRAAAFPVLRDLIVDRSAFDAIMEAGGYITAPTGAAPDANLTLVPKEVADAAMDAAACIGCGACVAACPNSAAQLFTSAKISHLNLLPQGQAERYQRTAAMVDTMEEFFGSCTNHGECQEACPKEISIDFIAYMNRDYVKAQIKNRKLLGSASDCEPSGGSAAAGSSWSAVTSGDDAGRLRASRSSRRSGRTTRPPRRGWPARGSARSRRPGRGSSRAASRRRPRWCRRSRSSATKVRYSMLLTPAVIGVNVRTIGTKRASTMASGPVAARRTPGPCRRSSCLKNRESGRLNSAGPDPLAEHVADLVADHRRHPDPEEQRHERAGAARRRRSTAPRRGTRR